MTIRDMLWCQGAGTVYDADEYRQMLQALVTALGGPGVVGTGALVVSERGSGRNMSVDVAAGGGFIAGTTNPFQGDYFALSDAVVNVTIAAANATNPRIDTIIVRAHDDVVDSGGTNAATIEVVTGTPAASPVRPTLPNSSLALADVAVAANATQVANGNITDRRVLLPGNLTASGNLAVSGNVTLSGAAGTVTAQLLRVTSTSDASLASTAHGFQVGATSGDNIIADGNEIMARHNGAEAALFLNHDSTTGGAGVVSVGDAGVTSTGKAVVQHVTVGSFSAGGGNGYISHDTLFAGLTTYAIAMNSAGDLFLNAGGSGGAVRFRKLNGTDLITVDSAFGVAVVKFPLGLPNAGTGPVTLQVDSAGQLGKQVSSRRYKTKVRTLTHELAERDAASVVASVRARAFSMKRSGERRVGFIAEEVADAFALGAVYGLDGRPEALDQTALLAVLWEAHQGQQRTIERLERRLGRLEAK